MALAHLMFISPAYYCGCRNVVLEELRNSTLGLAASLSSGTGSFVSRVPVRPIPLGFSSRRTNVVRRGRSNVTELQTVENAQIRTGVEIPVSCYQVIGVPNQAEKDEIVKSVMDLKSAEIEEGYTLDAVVSRQELLTDVRDKLLFEPEYAGNAREKVFPKSSIRIPWSWLPGAVCLLQEVGEGKLVLEIGRSALQHPDAKPYIHDLLLSMALAECAIAKIGFEKNKVSQGFEALARAQYLLRSKISLGKMPLLSEIEESLEKLAPACTIELLGMPHSPENTERRRGAIAALNELLRQGLDVETSCRVQDWPCFLGQALNKLMAVEIIDLLPWDNLAVARKNKKTLDSQNQRVVIDFDCFYMAMIAHIAIGFSTKQLDLIEKAKSICECLVASEGIDLKFEESLCSFLLGQVGESEAAEKLRELDINSCPASQNIMSEKEVKDGSGVNPSLEIWLKDAVLGLFPDTRDCSSSLVNFFRGEKKIHRNNAKQSRLTSQTIPINHKLPSICRNSEAAPSVQLGGAVKQLTPANLHTPLTGAAPSVQLKRNLGTRHKNFWESLLVQSDMVGKITLFTLVGCFFIATFKLFGMQFGPMRSPSSWKTLEPDKNTSSLAWTMDPSLEHKAGPACIDGSKIGRLKKLITMLKGKVKHPLWEEKVVSSSPIDLYPSYRALNKRQMSLEEAEALVKQWQTIKAEALGPNHRVQVLPEVLAESMLAQWHGLADSAKSRSCFWRFVLLQLSILRAEIVSDGIGDDMAEIEALLEEAAELVDGSQPKNQNYYSTYKIRYILKRQYDGSWRFCGSGIQSST